MADNQDDPATYPRLGQFIHRLVDGPAAVRRLILVLLAAGVLVVALDLTYEKHGYNELERIFGFYAGFGFISFTVVIFGARALRWFIKRPEDYYAPHVVDTEEYPEEELDKVEHDG